MINKVTLIGRLGQDPEIRYLEGNRAVARFSVATHENYQDKTGQWKEITEWHNVVLWGGAAESAERQLKKGMLVYVEGKLTHRKWQDKEGNDRYNTDVNARIFRSLEKRESSDGANLQNTGFVQSNVAKAVENPTTDDTSQPATDSQASEVDDELPF